MHPLCPFGLIIPPAWLRGASAWSRAGLVLATHSHTQAHTHKHTVCSPAAIICWHEHTPARALRGVGGLWVGGQVFWQGLCFPPCTLGCLSLSKPPSPPLSTQGLLHQECVCVCVRASLSLLCLSPQIANRCPSQSR